MQCDGSGTGVSKKCGNRSVAPDRFFTGQNLLDPSGHLQSLCDLGVQGPFQVGDVFKTVYDVVYFFKGTDHPAVAVGSKEDALKDEQ